MEQAQKIQAIIERFPQDRSYLIRVLLAIQEELRHVPDWALAAAAKHLLITTEQALEIAKRRKGIRLIVPGKYIVKVCIGASCQLEGTDYLVEAIKRSTRVGFDATTEDGVFTIENMDCVHLCGTGPIIDWNGKCCSYITREVWEKVAQDPDAFDQDSVK